MLTGATSEELEPIKTFTPPESDSKKFYESLKVLSYNNTYFGELKKPQPPWPKQHSL